VVHEDVAVGKVEHFWPPVFAGAIPAARPELPAQLKGDGRLPGPGRHGDKHSLLPFKDGLNDAGNR